MNTEYVIETDRLTKYYGSRAVVNSLCLRIPRGSVYGFLGRNGAGKSTTIKMLMGMVHPDSGSARVMGEEVASMPPASRSRIAYLAEGHPLYGWMTVANAERFTKACYPHWNSDLFEQIVDHFRLPRHRKIRRFSKGQQAQVSLALAMAPEPELLVMDDPTLGLDTVVRRDFLESMIQIIQCQGRTILFSSHILSDVERVADRIGIMVDGVLRVDCPTDFFKQSLRKVVLRFAHDAPAPKPCPGLVSSCRVGSRLELLLVGFDLKQQKIIESLEPRSVDIAELNLEDAFVEYTRGENRTLPVFSRKESDDSSTVLQGAA